MSKTKTAVTPLGDRVLVKRMAADEKTKLAASSSPTPPRRSRSEGIVVAVGLGKMRRFNGERHGA